MNPLRTTVARTALALTAVALFAASRLALAQPLPSAKELMDKHDAAIGGRAALDKHTSVHQTGAVSIPAMGVEATMDVYRAKPALFLQKLVIGPMGEILQGFDGKTAWAVQAGQPVVLEGAQAEMTKYNSDFFGNFHDMARYKSAETVELADFDGRKCYKVRIVRNIGGEGFEFFDAATGLGAGIIVSSESPMGKVETTSVFAEYKDFDGLKFPTKITQKTPMFESTITIKTMEFDKVAPETFALPDAVKALVKPPAP
ncbi:MAG TPA: hypothetical protein VIH11_05785 [Gemmatimonadaceae bacterium]|nr:hypothetical protein [Gemmatimonadaceae bacterium]